MNIPETLASLFSLSLALNRFLIIHSTAEKLIYDLTTSASKNNVEELNLAGAATMVQFLLPVKTHTHTVISARVCM